MKFSQYGYMHNNTFLPAHLFQAINSIVLAKHAERDYGQEHQIRTVLPAKSNSDVMFCLHHYQGLTCIIDISLVYLSYHEDSINTQVIYRFA